MTVERVEVIGKGSAMTPDEIIEGLQRPGVVDYAVLVRGSLDWQKRICILTLWIDSQIKDKVEAEIAELVQAVRNAEAEDLAPKKGWGNNSA